MTRATAHPLRRWLDLTLDVWVVLIAWWSVLYWVGLATQWSLWPFGWVWLAGSLPLVGWMVYVERRSAPDPIDEDDEDPTSHPLFAMPGVVRHESALHLAVAALAVAVAIACLWWPHSFKLVWLFLAAALALGVLARFVRPVAANARPVSSSLADLAAAALAIGIGVLSLFIHLIDLDDTFYVNRSVWVAEHGNASLVDTMFGPETYETPYNGGLPIASIEALLGVLSKMTHLHVGTITWVIVTGIASAMTVWAMWRLSRCWAPRWPLLVLALAVLFMLMSGESRLGNFWIARMWQGKVMAVGILIPIVWVYATQTMASRSRRPLFMLAISGVAFVGLTSTAVILAPIMTAGMFLAGALFRSVRLALGGVLFSIAPLVAGAAVAVLSKDVGGAQPPLLSGTESFVRVLGLDPVMAGLALLAVAASVLLIRPVLGSLMAAIAGLVCLVLFLPGLLTVINDLTGAGPILWRVLYCLPVAIFVGMLAVVRVPLWSAWAPSLHKVSAVAVPVVLAVAIVVAGAPLWSTTDHNGPVTVDDSPSWKVDLKALKDVEAVMETEPRGVILMPPDHMRLLPMYTTEAFAVVPRTWYAKLLDEPKKAKLARFQLSRLAAGQRALPTQKQVNDALERLDVTLACTGKSRHRKQVVKRLTTAGFTNPKTYGRLTCLTAASQGA